MGIGIRLQKAPTDRTGGLAPGADGGTPAMKGSGRHERVAVFAAGKTSQQAAMDDRTIFEKLRNLQQETSRARANASTIFFCESPGTPGNCANFYF